MAEKVDTSKACPVNGAKGGRWSPKEIPWSVAEIAHREYERMGHKQSLERIVERGGFGLEELGVLLSLGVDALQAKLEEAEARALPPEEVWVPVEGWPYLVSSVGGIRNARSGKRLKGRPKQFGHIEVQLSDEGRSRTLWVHRLVAKAFIPNPEGKPEVNHKNSMPWDNRVANLEWVTPEENVRHSFEHGFLHRKGSKNAAHKLVEEDIPVIRKMLADGLTPNHIAARYGVGGECIRKIRRGDTWKHVAALPTQETE